MAKAITELWNGRLDPGLHSGETNSELEALYDLMQRNLEKMKQIQNKEFAELAEKYNDCVDEYITVAKEEAFCDGFCLGMKIVVEALTYPKCTWDD